MSRRWLWMLGAAVLAAGCRNLELPPQELTSDPDGGVGPAPELALNSPAGGQVGETVSVNLSAASLVGVESVWLTCGAQDQITLATWSAPPYQATISLAPCTVGLSAQGDDAGDTLYAVTLTAHARSTNGRTAAPQSVQLTLDATTAAIRTDAPPRIVPLQPLQFRVYTDRALASDPEVRLGDQLAHVTRADAGTDGGIVYDVSVTAPGLGADLYAPGTTVPESVLEDVEELVSTTIDARLPNGNSSRLEIPLRLSRVLWERPVNGQLVTLSGTAPGLTDPRVTDAGLVIPINGVPALITPTGDLVQTLPASAHFTRLVATTPTGKALFTDDGGVPYVFDVPANALQPANGGLLPSGDSVWQDSLCTTTPGFNCTGQGSVVCTSLVDGSTSRSAVIPPGAGATAFGFTLNSGDTWIGTQDYECASGGNAWVTIAADGGVYKEATYTGNNGATCNYGNNAWPISNGDGTFLLAFQDSCIGSSSRVWWIGAGGEKLGSYRAPLADVTTTVTSEAPIGQVRGSDELVTLSSDSASTTTFHAWRPDGSVTPSGTTSLNGSFDVMAPWIGSDIGRGADTLDVLLKSPSVTTAFTVMQFQSSAQVPFRARYVYRYPRPTSAISLYAGESGPLYLVDAQNGWVVGLER